MAITLDLAPEEETLVRQKAHAQGREAERYVAELVLRDVNLVGRAAGVDGEHAESLEESLEGLIGVLSSANKNGGRKSHVAEGTGTAFTNLLFEKHEAGNQ